MRDNLLDELIADYMGIVAAVGRYRSDWFLRFMGLEQFPAYREGGRFQNYRGRPPLIDGAFVILQALVKAAAENLQQFDDHLVGERRDSDGRGQLLLALTDFTLEELAAEQAVDQLTHAIERLRMQARLPHAQLY